VPGRDSAHPALLRGVRPSCSDGIPGFARNSVSGTLCGSAESGDADQRAKVSAPAELLPGGNEFRDPKGASVPPAPWYLWLRLVRPARRAEHEGKAMEYRPGPQRPKVPDLLGTMMFGVARYAEAGRIVGLARDGG